jgi:hypothetical protein
MTHSHEFSPPWQPPRSGRSPYTPAPSPRKKKVQGATAP